ncbi:MAG: TonB-dependent receptor [Bacteroidales bacterium]|nr:TonB-dependent receptor [Bacteroidales bacterium]
MMKKIRLTLILIFFQILIPGILLAQLKVTGNVTDAEEGISLPGVTILEKNSGIGTITDIDGNYEITVPKDAILVFSYVGYAFQEIVVGTQTLINIQLQQHTELLDEIIVIGYGQVRKGDATGAITTVSTKDFNQGAITSPQELISGKIAGVSIVSEGGAPGSKSTIRIRGGSSLTASNDPLFVIDGIPVENTDIAGMSNVLNSINPDDIETFTVLKDASATAIYGSRASNGVILITTKKGKAGAKMSIDYSTKFSISDIKETVDVLSADQYTQLVTELENAGTISSGAVDKLGTASTDWQDEIYKTAFGQDHNLGITGSLYDIPYRVSGSYSNKDGILKTSNNERATGNIRLSPSFLDDHLKINAGIKYSYIENRFADRGAIGSAVRMDPTQSIYNQTGLYGGYYTWKGSTNQPNFLATTNPLALLDFTYDESIVNRYIGDIQLEYKFHFLPELKANAKFGYDYSDSKGDRDIDPRASWYTFGRTEIQKHYTQEKKNELFDFYLNYKKDIESINSKIDVMGGYSWQHFWDTNEDDIFFKDGETKNVFGEKEYYLLSFFGRLNYIFMDKYLLTFTLREDASSRFSKDNNKRWGLFPSLALAWRISDESFMQNIDVINNLKLRLGYGKTGQQDIGDNYYSYMPLYVIGDQNCMYSFGDHAFYTIRPSGYDPNIKWETTTTYNIGLDFGLYKNRIYGSLEFYKRETEDLLSEIPIAIGSNFTDKLITNVGNLENTGFEIELNSIIYNKKDIFWEIGANFSYNDNEITNLTKFDDPNYKGVDVGGIGGATGNTIQKHAVGYPINTFFVYEQVYDSNGKPIEGLYVDRNGDGIINDDDKYFAESPAANMLFGFSTRVEYKNFDFSLSARANLNNYIYDNVNSDMARYDNIFTNDYLANLTTNIYNTEFRAMQPNSDYYLHNASFLKIDNITLGYTFDDLLKPMLNNIDLGIRLYATVQNAFTITEYDGLDPEIHGGIDNNIYPRPRIFLFGISARF